MFAAQPAFGLLAGPLIVFTVLARHGVGWARTTAVAIVGLSTLLQVVLLVVSSAAIGEVVVAIVVVALMALLVAAALAMLYQQAATDFYGVSHQ